ncbi:MAG TPA: efflux RND transporter periplasmic adaptor subunit [Aquabacterium sp.]|nr:efflux RND transporter periplasmic adaptor subunit [Aquabacterium sp.]
MKRSRAWLVGTVVLIVCALGIGRTIMNRKAEQARLTQSQNEPAGRQTLSASDLVQAQRAEWVRTVGISGNIQAIDSVVIKARVPGEVVTLSVREGDAVQQGQVLIKLDPRDQQARLEQAQQQAAAAKAQWAISQRTLENNQALVAQGFISRNALDTSVSSATAAKSTWQAAQAAVDLARKAVEDTRLSTPIKGMVAKQYVQVGERVNVDARLLDVVDLSRVELQASLRPEDITQVRVGTRGQIRVDGLKQPIEAQVARINPSAAPGTRAVTVYLSLKPHEALRQGLFANGQLELARATSLILPRSVIRQRTNGSYVQLVRQGKVVHQAVTLGAEGQLASDQTLAVVEVRSGLDGGESILKESLGLVKEGAEVVITPAAKG